MKILYLSYFDLQGGAARGAYRLHRGFLNNNIDSTLLVNKKISDDQTVIEVQSKIRKAMKFNPVRMANRILKTQNTTNNIIHSINVFPSNLHRYINSSNADIVILHWVGNEMINIAEIGKINKPIIWRLADQWAFCGAEHYTLLSEQNNRYINGYTSTNRPQEEKGLDINRWTWKRKIKHWYDKPMTIVTGSNWLADCAKKSYLFKKKRVEVIPTGLDIDVFKPVPKKIARKVLNLPLDKHIVLFGALSATKDDRKGYIHLINALNKLYKEASIPLLGVIFGASQGLKNNGINMPVRYLSTLKDDWSLVLAYSSADVMVVPSKQEAFGQTASEAMACGTPVVAFGATGLLDIVDHKINGYLATPFDTAELAQGIRTILENDSLRAAMSEKSRQKALQEYDVNIQVNRYLQLIKTLN